MASFFKDRKYREVNTKPYIVDSITYKLYIPTQQDEHDYTMMKKQYPDVYKEFDSKKHPSFSEKVTGLVNAMRKVRGEKNWKDDEYIWFYDDARMKEYYAVAPEWDQHDYSHLDHLDVKPISGADAFPSAIDLLYGSSDESDYYSDEDEKVSAKKEAKKAEQMRIRKENNERRKKSNDALKAWNKSEKKEAKEAAKAAKMEVEKKAKEAAKKAKKEANEAAKAEKEAAKADKALAKANKVINTIDSLKGGKKTRNNMGKSNRRTQKKKITK